MKRLFYRSKCLNTVFKDCLYLNNLPALQKWTVFTWQFYYIFSSAGSENHDGFYPVSRGVEVVGVEVVYHGCEHQKVYVWLSVC